MRRLVACEQCKRQYNASRLKTGTRFRCRCGRVLRVQALRGHDSRVVRCSSCGAPRGRGAAACVHCGADFTLHERDLHTICPECLTRVSDRARYCHSCGTPLCPDEEIGGDTPLSCPACREEPHLHSRCLGHEAVSALECDACAGLWLGVEAFEHLARHARRTSVPATTARPGRRDVPCEAAPPQRSGYRPCPHCAALMQRRNYGLRGGEGGSGVLIDSCRDHGLWFDSGELTRVLDWLNRGGQAPPTDAAERERERRKSINPDPLTGGRPMTTVTGELSGWDVLDWFTDGGTRASPLFKLLFDL